jgi:hypothetical protein
MAVSDAPHYAHGESWGTRDGCLTRHTMVMVCHGEHVMGVRSLLLSEAQRLTRHGDKSFSWHKILILHDDLYGCENWSFTSH